MRSVHTGVHTDGNDLLPWEEDERADAAANRVFEGVIEATFTDDPVGRALLHRWHHQYMARERTRKAKLAAKFKQADDGVRSNPILVDYAEAAKLLGTTVSALKTRMSRGDPKLMAARVVHGRAVRFNVAKLIERHTPGRRS